MAKEHYTILCVENHDGDRRLLQIALRRTPRLALAGIVEDGGQAISYLAGTGGYADRRQWPFPDALLLDLKMPGATGFDVLEWLRHHTFPELKVVVLSDSIDPSDKQKAMDLGAHRFEQKPMDLHGLLEILLSLEYCLINTT